MMDSSDRLQPPASRSPFRPLFAAIMAFGLVGSAVCCVAVTNAGSQAGTGTASVARPVWALLHSEIRNGDDLQDVQSILGTNMTITGADASQVAQHLSAHNAASPEVRDDDTFVVCEDLDADGNARVCFLQFRDGALINHDPDRYQD